MAMIMKKEDTNRLLQYIKNRYTYYDDPFWYIDTSQLNKVNVKIWFEDDQGMMFCSGTGWKDQKATRKTDEELLQIMWDDRKFINKEYALNI